MKTMKFKQQLTVFVVALATAGAGQAQEESEGMLDNRRALEEIVVTATKYEKSLMKTPVAVTAVTQDSLTRKSITNVPGIAQLVPNMQIGLESTGSAGVQASVRGVTSTNFTEIGDPSVSVHIDGLYSSRPQGSLALMFDVEQVEALRGPQGTLFGRNSPGGTINIITAKADTQGNYGNVHLDLGNYNKRLIKGVGNFAISDKFALRVAAMALQRDGFIDQHPDLLDRHIPSQGIIADGIPDVSQRFARDVGDEDAYYNADEWGARISARFLPTDSLTWDLVYEIYRNDGAGALQLKDCDAMKGTLYPCNGDLWQANVNVPGVLDMDIDSLRSHVVWNLSDSTILEWHLGYQITDRRQITDGDAGWHLRDDAVTVNVPVPAWGDWGTWLHDSWINATLKAESKNLVNEFQLKQEFDTFRYVAGIFLMDENTETQTSLDYEMHAEFGYPHFSYYDQPDRNVESQAIFAQGDWNFSEPWTLTLGVRQSWDEKSDKGGQSWEPPWAGYVNIGGTNVPFYYNRQHTPVPGQIPHNGLQITRNMGPWIGPEYLRSFGIEPSQNSYSKDWEKFNYRVGLQYDIDENHMVFTSLSTGYKAGGFGDRVDRCGGGTCEDGSTEQYTHLDYEPEEVTSLEVGYRGSVLDDSMNIGATLFYMDYENMQFTGMHAIGRQQSTCTWAVGCELTNAWKTENIGESEIYGLELEYDWIPWDNGRLSGYISWLHTEVEEFDTYSEAAWFCGQREQYGAEPCVDPYEGSEIELRGRRLYDVTGNQLPYSPEVTVAANISHTFSLGTSGLTLMPLLSARWQDEMYFTVRNLDNNFIGDKQDAYTNVDASIRLSGSAEDWYIEIYGTNLTDNAVKNWMNNDQADFLLASFSPPRQYGLRGQFNF